MVSVFPWYYNNPRISSPLILPRPVKTVSRSFPVTENPFYPVQLPIECSEISSILVDPSWRKSPSHWQKSSNTAYIGSNIYSKMKLTLTLWEICTVDTTSKSYANMTSKSAYIMTSIDMTSMSGYMTSKWINVTPLHCCVVMSFLSVSNPLVGPLILR